VDILKAMRSFVAVVDKGGFASAARFLRLSPPVVTRDVAALEARFGCKLMQRTTRQVRLTEAGRRYLSDARRILAEVAEAEASVIGSHGDLRGPIAVTAPAMFGRLYVGPAVADFARQHPSIVFTTLFLDRMVDLIEEGVDVAVRIARLADSSAIAIRVGAVRHILCAAPTYLDAHGVPTTPRDLEKMEAIDILGSKLPWSFQNGGRTSSVQPPTRLVANSVEMAIEAASASCGVVRLLSYQAVDAIAAGRLIPILEPYEPEPVPVHVVHLEARASPRRTRIFIDYLVEGLRGQQALKQAGEHSA
jgi:DNA-binding transcriptional LysR family regulator